MAKLGGKNGEKSGGLVNGHWPEDLTHQITHHFRCFQKMNKYSAATSRYPISGDMWLARNVFKSLLTTLFTTGAHTGMVHWAWSTEICMAGNRGQKNYTQRQNSLLHIYYIILPCKKLWHHLPEKSKLWFSHLLDHLDRKCVAPRYLWTPSLTVPSKPQRPHNQQEQTWSSTKSGADVSSSTSCNISKYFCFCKSVFPSINGVPVGPEMLWIQECAVWQEEQRNCSSRRAKQD